MLLLLLQDQEEEEQVDLDDEEEPEVLDIDNPSFDMRSPEELPSQPAQTDLVDSMEFEEDTSLTETMSQRSSCFSSLLPLPFSPLP